MSFSSDTKKEIMQKLPERVCCRLAELSGLMLFSMKYEEREHPNLVRLNTENEQVAKRAVLLVEKTFRLPVSYLKTEPVREGGAFRYYISFHNPEDTQAVLKSLGFYQGKLLRYRINRALLEKNCCKQAFIRGAFLGSGTVLQPENAYHLEFVTHHAKLCEQFGELLSELYLDARTVLRKSNHVIYFKESEQIADILRMVGAGQALMSLENTRILKEIRNNVNRIVNCEQANMDKTVNAAIEQTRAIQKIEARMGLQKLPKQLEEIARLRLEFPDVSLKELGEMLSPKLGKSGVNHRLRKLVEIAEADSVED